MPGVAYNSVHGVGSNTFGTVATTGSMAFATGDGCVLFASWDNGAGATATPSNSAGISVTWTSKIAKFVDSRHTQAMQAWYGSITSGGTGTVTVTLTASSFGLATSVVGFNGHDSSQFNATGTSVTDSGTAVTQAITPGVDGCLLIGYAYNDSGTNTISAGSGMTAVDNDGGSGQNTMSLYRTTNPGQGASSLDWTFSSTNDAITCAVAVAPFVAPVTFAFPKSPRGRRPGPYQPMGGGLRDPHRRYE